VLRSSNAQELGDDENILYIIVNAQVGGKHDWSQRASLPSLRSLLSSVSGTGIYRYNFETIELLRESTEKWAEAASKQGVPLKVHVVELAFDSLADPKEREFFNEVKTSFSLDDETVTRLIDVGGKLLDDSSDFQDFMSGMQ
jgi:NTE family protein